MLGAGSTKMVKMESLPLSNAANSLSFQSHNRKSIHLVFSKEILKQNLAQYANISGKYYKLL